MSKLKQRRKKMGYEPSVARCATCRNYKKPYVYLTTNSMTRESPPFCRLGEFSVTPVGCCDHWSSRSGDTLIPESMINPSNEGKAKHDRRERAAGSADS